MVQVNNGDGKTRETAIIIMSAEDRKEGWDYIKSKVGNWIPEYSSITDEYDYETQYVVFRKYEQEIWFDWTWLYNFMR